MTRPYLVALLIRIFSNVIPRMVPVVSALLLIRIPFSWLSRTESLKVMFVTVLSAESAPEIVEV
jgi:hypothetical protein